jgi:hypothetical protein
VDFAREEFRRNKDVGDLVCFVLSCLGCRFYGGRDWDWNWDLRANRMVLVDADSVFDFDGEDAVGGGGEVY